MLSYFKREPGFYKKLIALALPMIVQNLITNSLGLVDTFMVGTMGEAPLAGVTLANIPIFVVQLMMFGFQSGSSVLISQYKGKGDLESINRVMGLGMYAAGAITFAFALLLSFVPHQFMSLFGNDPEIIAIAAGYARIVGWSYFFDSFVQIYNGTHRAMGEPRRGMYILCISMVVNTFLNWVFIFGKLGSPAMGAEGAALATLLARVVSFVIMVVWAVLDKKFRINLSLLLRPGREMGRRFLQIATPVVLNETLWSLGSSMYPTIMGHMDGSKEILAAYAISGNVEKLCTVAVFAVAGTSAIIVGREIGAGRKDTVYDVSACLITVAITTGAIAGLFLFVLLHLLIRPVLYPLFGLSATAAAISSSMLSVICLFLPIRSFCTTIIVGILRGGGDVKAAAMLDILPLWCIAVPAVAITGLVLHLPILWVYLCIQLEETFKFILGMKRFLSHKWIHDVTCE